MEGWKRIGMFPSTLTVCSFCALLPSFFHKHSGCYGNGLIDVAEKPKNLKRFDNAGLIRNSCNQMVSDLLRKVLRAQGMGTN